MATHGLKPGAFVYIADSAMVTEGNLAMIGDNFFLTRLPFSYNETSRIVSETVAAGNWEEIGVLNDTPSTAKRRLNRLERQLEGSTTSLTKLIGKETRAEFLCREDAEAAVLNLRKSSTDLYSIIVSVKEMVHYVRGRPPKNGERKVACIRYVLEACIEGKSEQIQREREESGCFVLLTNVPQQGDMAETGAALLQIYKEQYGIERNFPFLKDP